MPSLNYQKPQGFSLLEVLFAMLILSLAITGLMLPCLQITQDIHQQKDYWQAVRILQNASNLWYAVPAKQRLQTLPTILQEIKNECDFCEASFQNKILIVAWPAQKKWHMTCNILQKDDFCCLSIKLI